MVLPPPLPLLELVQGPASFFPTHLAFSSRNAGGGEKTGRPGFTFSSPRYNAKHRRRISIRIRCSYLAAATRQH